MTALSMWYLPYLTLPHAYMPGSHVMLTCQQCAFTRGQLLTCWASAHTQGTGHRAHACALTDTGHTDVHAHRRQERALTHARSAHSHAPGAISYHLNTDGEKVNWMEIRTSLIIKGGEIFTMMQI